MIREEYILYPSTNGRYSPRDESIANKWNNFFLNSSGSETYAGSNDSDNESTRVPCASRSFSSPTNFKDLKIDDTQEVTSDNSSDNSPTVKGISLAHQSPKRNTDGLCQITLSGFPSTTQDQAKRIANPPGFRLRQELFMEPSHHDDEDHSEIPPIRHSYSISSRLDDHDRVERLSNGNDNSMLKSVKGTVRGYKNMVRRYSASFNSKGHVIPTEQSIDHDLNRIIIYTTSMTAVRATTEACAYVKKVFQNRGIPFEEHDVFIHKEHQKEMQKRLGTHNGLTFPQVFINGVHIGGLKEIEELNESGKLLSLVAGFERSFKLKECSRCGGRRFINCSNCGGSKTSRKHRLVREICALRCTSCNENGLVQCPDCAAQVDETN